MKLYISYSRRNTEFVTRLTDELQKHGIDFWIDTAQLKPGDNFQDRMLEGLRGADAILVVLSRASVASEWVTHEVTTFALMEERRIIPLLTEDCAIPTLLQELQYVDFRDSFAKGFEELRQGLDLIEQGAEPIGRPKPQETRTWLSVLQNAFTRGELCLFVGAGVSADAGMPQWTKLLNELLSDMFGGRGPGSDLSPEERDRLATLFQERLALSSLITGQYLKTALGNDFGQKVRNALYDGTPISSHQVEAVVELCRPRRMGSFLKSIVTFNFDDLLERNLAKHEIRYHSIHAEGQRCPPDCIPIYHVHGFLPSGDEELKQDHGLVFSEDAYHTQFMDAYSWSNLTQLGELTQSTCLLVGLSLTDPNLRRLLDVAMRKNPDGALNHYIIRRRHDEKSLLKGVEHPGEEEQLLLRTLRRRAHVLEEEDATNLGLNMIWIDEFDEIAPVLREIAVR